MLPQIFKTLRKANNTQLVSAVGLFWMSCFMLSASESQRYDVEVMATGISAPWSIKQSPNQEVVVTQRKGSVLVFDTDWSTLEHNLLLDDLYYAGQGGLLDLVFHPNFAENNWVYVSYSAGTSADNHLKVVRFQWPLAGVSSNIDEFQIIHQVSPSKDTPVHFAGRIAFTADQSLLLASGDGFDYREQAQIKDSQLGKILRLTAAGEAHPNNPFYDDGQSPKDYVYSLGHRNPQGLLVNADGKIISHEHGPDGGDEINLIRAGDNYGWPVITYGKDYIGASISPFTEYPGMQQPKLDWTPSIAPSGMIQYRGNKFTELRGALLVTSLKYKNVRVLRSTNATIQEEMVLLERNSLRLRDVTQTQQGDVLLLTDNDNAQILRLTQY